MSFQAVYNTLARKGVVPDKAETISSQLAYERQLNAALKSQFSKPAKAMKAPPAFTREKEGSTMTGVQIKEIEGEIDPGFHGISLPGADSVALLQNFRQEVQVATGQAVERSMAYADQLSKGMLEQVRNQLAGLNRPRVMVVEIEKKQRKLTKPASPYLGELLTNAKLGIHTLMVGPAGCGKTIAAAQVAEALGLEFGHISCTAGASESWIFGRQTANGFVEADFSRMYRDGGVFLFDEWDAADPNFALSVNTALSGEHMTNPISGQKIKKHANFVCLAAANTVGRGSDSVYPGRNRLDGSSLDRFEPLGVDYSDEIESRVCPDKALRELLQTARTKLRELKSPEIMSTRKLERAYLRKGAGVDMERILGSITMGWPEGLAEQVGLGIKQAKASATGERVTKEVF